MSNKIEKQDFVNYQQWLDYGSMWLTTHLRYNERYFRPICFDTKGRLCVESKDFMRADEEDAFPVRWVWPDQVAEYFARQVDKDDYLKHDPEAAKAMADEPDSVIWEYTSIAKRDDGGPAFPENLTATPAGDVYRSSEMYMGAGGMKLRDWFAGQAIAQASRVIYSHHQPEDVARRAYMLADAMLEARKVDATSYPTEAKYKAMSMALEFIEDQVLEFYNGGQTLEASRAALTHIMELARSTKGGE